MLSLKEHSDLNKHSCYLLMIILISTSIAAISYWSFWSQEAQLLSLKNPSYLKEHNFCLSMNILILRKHSFCPSMNILISSSTATISQWSLWWLKALCYLSVLILISRKKIAFSYWSFCSGEAQLLSINDIIEYVTIEWKWISYFFELICV